MTVEQQPPLPHLEPPTTAARPTVPDLIGLSLRDACQTAAWAGMRISSGSTVRHGPSGVVVAQSPPPGSCLQPLWRIHVLVSEARPAAEQADA